jgi:hypothetical protein
MSKSLLLLAATLVLGTAAAATEVETTTGALAVTPVGSSTQYNTTGIQIGNYLYLYHQGGASGTACPAIPGDPAPSTGDQVIAYRALLTNGVPGSFQLIGRISPCVKAPVCTPLPPHWDCASTFPLVSLGPGQVFRATINGVTKYHLLADASDTLSSATCGGPSPATVSTGPGTSPAL